MANFNQWRRGVVSSRNGVSHDAYVTLVVVVNLIFTVDSMVTENYNNNKALFIPISAFSYSVSRFFKFTLLRLQDRTVFNE